MELKNQLEFTDLFVSRKLWRKVRKPVITFLIFFHVALVLMYYSGSVLLINKVLEHFNRYYVFLGLEQSFQVFAPSPRRHNVHMIAAVTYKNGMTKIHSLPRLERVPLIEKQFKERFRKFYADNLSTGKFNHVAPDVARFIARQENKYPDNPPKVVALMSYASHIPPIENGIPKDFLNLQTKLEEEDKTMVPEILRTVPSIPRSERAYNVYGNMVNPPRSAISISTIYQVKPEDLK